MMEKSKAKVYGTKKLQLSNCNHIKIIENKILEKINS